MPRSFWRMPLGCQRIELYTAFDDRPGEQSRSSFRELVRCRAEGTPVAYLVGHREFYSLSFRVTPDVLIPRPETELLVMAALDLARGQRNRKQAGEPASGGEAEQEPAKATTEVSSSVPSVSSAPRIADIGTGSGIIAVCLAKHLPTCRITAIDISPAALAVAAENAKAHGVADRIEFIESDLFASLPSPACGRGASGDGGSKLPSPACGRGAGGEGGKELSPVNSPCPERQRPDCDRAPNPDDPRPPNRPFDFIVSNPPYVGQGELERLAPSVRKFEPQVALLAGPRGTEVIERLIPQAAERLRPGGHLLMEISPMIHDAVRGLIEADGRFELGPTIKDLARLPRVVQATRKAEA